MRCKQGQGRKRKEDHISYSCTLIQECYLDIVSLRLVYQHEILLFQLEGSHLPTILNEVSQKTRSTCDTREGRHFTFFAVMSHAETVCSEYVFITPSGGRFYVWRLYFSRDVLDLFTPFCILYEALFWTVRSFCS